VNGNMDRLMKNYERREYSEYRC